ncbi:helix-turn-helix domain-containing protein [Flammeovirga kamogawensis]|uniref:Helix-turn-helix transcriptional regulator n=1 Tax=Flammeovirga kamogawensis TaxID=373891 RepID=A0ABX8GUP4_9BACT|nr:AraC family transcriptional regulator [Flammeovirga kamogawensis]MBB6459860.1 AraC-like DNA-binding protein [Flammeovirga kamogawensis]QWG07086.1 helix-turn-helix transcriptional regulator [Flammeovirga kamogawensis]TRX68907.1 helix-turn-helix transcriptional regulator [Flammeovirga kamogawensis]
MPQPKLKETLSYWSEIFNGSIENNCVSFNNEIAKGSIKGVFFSDDLYLLQFDIFLNQQLSDLGENLVDDSDYVNFLFGQTEVNTSKHITFEVEERIDLRGVVVSNNKKSLNWFQPANIPLKLLLLKVSKQNFTRLVNQSVSLKNSIKKEESFTKFDNLDPVMLGTLLRIFEIDDPVYGQELMEHCSNYLITLTMSKLSKNSLDNDDSSLNMTALFHARQLIIDKKGADIPIDFLAKEAGMSVSRLRLLFKTFFEVPIYQFQQQIRLEESKKLLLEGEKTQAMIAMDLGFSTSSHFTAVFKKYYGYTPKEFKKNNTA